MAPGSSPYTRQAPLPAFASADFNGSQAENELPVDGRSSSPGVSSTSSVPADDAPSACLPTSSGDGSVSSHDVDV